MAAIIKRLHTARSLLNWLKTVDGSGSGLDADLLDGLHGSAYALLSGAAFTGNVSVNAAPLSILGTPPIIYYWDTAVTNLYAVTYLSGAYMVHGVDPANVQAGSAHVFQGDGSNIMLLFAGGGLVMSGATGGDKGAGTGNFVGLYKNNDPVATIGATNNFTERQNISFSGGGGNFCLYLNKGGEVTPHLRIDMPVSVQTGDRFVDFQSAGTTSGTIAANGASNVTYNTSSDERLKTDLVPVDPEAALERLLSIPIYDGKWKSDGSPFRGFLTKDLRDKIPGMVSGIPDGMEQDWVVITPEGEIRETFVVRAPEEDGYELMLAKHPDALELHMLSEKIAPECADYSRGVPELIAALPAILGRIDGLQARIAVLESRLT